MSQPVPSPSSWKATRLAAREMDDGPANRCVSSNLCGSPAPSALSHQRPRLGSVAPMITCFESGVHAGCDGEADVEDLIGSPVLRCKSWSQGLRLVAIARYFPSGERRGIP